MQDKILTDLASMLASAAGSSDMLLECGKEAPVPAHRAVLAAACDGFRGEIAQATIMSPKRKGGSGKLEVKLSSNHDADCLTAAGANALLQFVYFGNTQIAPAVAVNLICALADFKIASLEAACELAIQEFDVHTAFPILGVTFHPMWVARPSAGSVQFFCFILAFF
jgi:hypothetical protein